MKIGIFGGSFNPIHFGHIALAKEIKELAGLDEVWFMVSPHNPLKSTSELMPDQDRLLMTELALQDMPGLTASDYEFHLPKPSYMSNTLNSLAHDYPNNDFTLIIGADNWLVFDKWHDHEEILRSHKIIIYPRKDCLINADTLPHGVSLVHTKLYEISSTQIRQRLRNQEPVTGLVPEKIAERLEESYGKQTLISILVPVYNKAKYVENCLKSAAEQQFDKFEVIAVDDGSTDGSGEICDRLAKKYDTLKVIHTENSGVTAARRTAYEHSTGKYITFADADDIMLPGALRKLYDEMTRSGADEVVARATDQHGKLRGIKGGRYMDPAWMTKMLITGKADFCILWGVMFRKEQLAGCLDTPRKIRSGEDILMQIKYLKSTPKVWFSDEPVYMYNAGLPNDRPLDLDEQMLYDKILRSLFGEDDKEINDCITIHMAKMYENFINDRQFGVMKEYYNLLRKGRLTRLPLADRIAVALPPCLAYILVATKKKLL